MVQHQLPAHGDPGAVHRRPGEGHRVAARHPDPARRERRQEIDLYDFLLKGDTRADIRLLQGDVVFVPVVGKLAAVAGEVRRPAIYELKGEKTLLDLVRLAGGFTPAAYKRRVQVERLEGNTARVVLDADADELEKRHRRLRPRRRRRRPRLPDRPGGRERGPARGERAAPRASTS